MEVAELKCRQVVSFSWTILLNMYGKLLAMAQHCTFDLQNPRGQTTIRDSKLMVIPGLKVGILSICLLPKVIIMLSETYEVCSDVS